MTDKHDYYRIVQPLDERRLCRVEYAAESITCPVNALHQRMGRRISNLRVSPPPRKFNHFCYSWGAQHIASKSLVRNITDAGLTGFDILEIENKFDFMNYVEFVVEWHGEFVRSLSTTVLSDYCSGCGLLEFSLENDPPWELFDISSQHDFFVLAPFNSLFCTSRAYAMLKDLCGEEFVAVPAIGELKFDPPITRCSISWPPINPALKGGLAADVMNSIHALDAVGILSGDLE